MKGLVEGQLARTAGRLKDMAVRLGVLPEAAEQADAAADPSVDVVVCVHNALEHVKACLDSLLRRTRIPHRLIIVDDGSGPKTAAFLAELAAAHPHVVPIRNDTAVGYTRAANQALRLSTADYVVLLNSDTIVPRGWLAKLLDCARARPDGGVFGPLSNAALFQSIPRLKDGKEWCVNALPEGLGLRTYAAAVAGTNDPLYPRVRLINGFCYMISRKALDAVGLLDEESFPLGYGEEDDFSLRADKAGFGLYVVDTCYVFHAKSQSYTDQRRQQILPTTKNALREKHTSARVALAIAEMQYDETLLRARLRASLAGEAAAWKRRRPAAPARPLRIAWEEPGPDASAEARAVFAMSSRMRALGVESVVVPRVGSPGTEGEGRAPAPAGVDAVIVTDSTAGRLADARGDLLLVRLHLDAAGIGASLLGPLGPAALHLAGSARIAEAIAAQATGIEIGAVAPAGIDTTRWRPLSVPVTYDVGFGGSRAAADPQSVEILRACLLMRVLALADVELGDDDRAAWIARCRIFAAAEGLGISALEAMACGVPVVAIGGAGADDHVLDRVNALVVPAGDSRALRRAFVRLTSDLDLRRTLIEGGMHTAWEHSLERSAARLVELIRARLAVPVPLAEADLHSAEASVASRL
jgi:GT2 family glycosyltransferase